jgi:lipid A disaccharide synthetase
MIVPEIIQNNVTPANITYELEELLYNQVKREQNINELAQVKGMLSSKNSALEVAKIIDIELFS